MVYIIGNKKTNLLKIGFTADFYRLKKRISVLSTSSPIEFDALKLYEGGLKTEKSFHRYFCKNRIRNEWFSIGDRLDSMDNIYKEVYKNDSEFFGPINPPYGLLSKQKIKKANGNSFRLEDYISSNIAKNKLKW
jgi:hypothetical protein